MKNGLMVIAIFTFFAYLAVTGRLDNIVTIVTSGKVVETPAVASQPRPAQTGPGGAVGPQGPVGPTK